jgi:hypothetical protein
VKKLISGRMALGGSLGFGPTFHGLRQSLDAAAIAEKA